jgi:hypothetical protein
MDRPGFAAIMGYVATAPRSTRRMKWNDPIIIAAVITGLATVLVPGLNWLARRTTKKSPKRDALSIAARSGCLIFGADKYNAGASYRVEATFSLHVGELDVYLIDCDAIFRANGSAAKCTEESRYKLDHRRLARRGQQLQDICDEHAALITEAMMVRYPVQLARLSSHDLAFSCTMRPPLSTQAPGDFIAGTLAVELTYRSTEGLIETKIPFHFVFNRSFNEIAKTSPNETV